MLLLLVPVGVDGLARLIRKDGLAAAAAAASCAEMVSLGGFRCNESGDKLRLTPLRLGSSFFWRRRSRVARLEEGGGGGGEGSVGRTGRRPRGIGLPFR